MPADYRHDQTAIRIDLGAIFVSLELSRATWLITSLSPGRRLELAGTGDYRCRARVTSWRRAARRL